MYKQNIIILDRYIIPIVLLHVGPNLNLVYITKILFSLRIKYKFH